MIDTNFMLTVLIKALTVFIVVLFCIRLMGKRQLGEMQPFELVITLIIADLACVPINDPYIPFYAGIVPIITLAFFHIVFSFIARKSLFMRNILSGQPVIVIDKKGINYKNLKKMNLNVNDLIEAIHTGGYMDINEIEYAIFETNGNMSVVEKETDPTQPVPALYPLSVIIDGKRDIKNMEIAGIKDTNVLAILKKNNIKDIRDVLYMDVRQDGTVYVSPKNSPYFTDDIKVRGEW